MGVLRWLLRFAFWIVRWPFRRAKARSWDDDEPRRSPRKRAHTPDRPNVFRIEVDNELGRFHSEGPAFSFWSSSRIILILSVLLWWIQPAGPMIAGYVGGRRAGSPWKAVVAAVVPIFAILVINYAYTHNFASRQIDFVASLPLLVGDGIASVLPFLAPYRDFLITYLQGFVEALRTTFGMGTNGYLMVIIFAYIGGLIGEQARRELASRAGGSSTQSFGVHLPWPFAHAEAHAPEDDVDVEDEEDLVPHRHRRPVHAKVHPGPARAHGRHRGAERLEDLRKVPAETVGAHTGRRVGRARRQPDEEEDEPQDDEEPVRSRRPSKARVEHRPESAHREAEGPHREPRPVKLRSREEELAIQKFVERALRNYDKSKL
ncbi:MAG TPA: hypothetical protein VJ300_08910 [Thermoplasmata archaeon]|nr:hypothetical protein [Thermoplasmata archaeon]